VSDALRKRDAADLVDGIHHHKRGTITDAERHAWAIFIQLACAAALAATILFNAVLALINASVMPVPASAVAMLQGTIVIAAFAIGVLDLKSPPYFWVAITWWLLMAAIAIAAFRAQLNPKDLGDLFLVPAMIVLGMRMTATTLIRTVLTMQMMILLVGIWELADPTRFGATFKVASYYINSRGFTPDQFWAGGDLFISAERPHGRFLLDGLGLHRGSSLFLEPVSLGNWTIVVTIWTAALWRQLGQAMRTFMIASNIALLVICDGRLALAVCVVLVAYLPLARRLPGWISVFYLPAFLAGLWTAVGVGLLTEVGDTFAGRLRYGLDALGLLDVPRMLGISIDRAGFEDAGWAYFIQSQSVLVAIAMWLIVTLTNIGEDAGGRAAKHATALFLALCLPVSNGVFSIKTAGLMWVCYGFCYARAHKSNRLEGVRTSNVRVMQGVPT
jgi:putative polymerase